METTMPSSATPPVSVASSRDGPASSGVAWGGVLGGAFVAAALALILLMLGTGLGLSAVSPWSYEGAAAKNVAIAGVIWMVFSHLCSSAVAGYLAGRLRTQWLDVHTDEVIFRDTANGLVSWAVGIVLTAAFLATSAASIVGGTAKAGATAASAATAGAAAGATRAKGTGADPNAYFVDSLFRSDGSSNEDDSSIRNEAGRIVANGLQQGDVPAADKAYLVQVVSTRTGLSPPDAEKRVTEALAQAKAAEVKAREAADVARKASAEALLWTFLALLLGAFTAGYTATIGGKHRDFV